MDPEVATPTAPGPIPAGAGGSLWRGTGTPALGQRTLHRRQGHAPGAAGGRTEDRRQMRGCAARPAYTCVPRRRRTETRSRLATSARDRGPPQGQGAASVRQDTIELSRCGTRGWTLPPHESRPEFSQTVRAQIQRRHARCRRSTVAGLNLASRRE